MDNNNQKKRNNCNSAPGFFRSKRFLFILLGMILFLPPLSILPQLTGDNNLCGAYCPRMFFLWHKGETISNYLMGFIRSYMGVILVLGVVVTTFFFGRYWCSHLCPIGGTMELGSRIMPKWLKIDFSNIPSSPIRYGYFTVYLLAPILGLGSLCCSYCNYVAIPRLVGSIFFQADIAYFLRTAGLINLGLVVLLGFLAKDGRAYCNFLCPIGALDAISNRLGLKFGKRIRVDESKCDSCGVCAKVCPTWSIDMKERARIDHLSCMPCRECEKICPKEAISYGRIEK